ncbi:LPD29 domain-containing protein [Vagococcus elongatus]|uniref:J domain-containing protein n=1 Tax=Vagococcus elongatus TaxID=180344 RepID=A0A430AW42_9ENTE|nr:LPD29 domain-containing protein [Vagococcus elongatus]RSU12284.1 hypothetical protein CBF29_06700 [Vagococcus elongatus]
MAHFKRVKSFDDLKKQFRELSKKHHPDITGGDDSVIKEINNEYDMLFPIWKTKSKVKTTETASSTRSEFYTQYGWAGSQYNSNLGTKEIAANLRKYVKEVYPTWKFSITCQFYSGGSSISVAAMEAPYEILERDKIKDNCYVDFYDHEEGEDFKAGGINIDIHRMRDREEMPILNDFGYEVLNDVFEQLMSYRYDDSDGMIDYFSTNFYYSFGLGKYDKGFRIVEKTARVKSPKFEVKK